jgi:hypothetical protein
MICVVVVVVVCVCGRVCVCGVVGLRGSVWLGRCRCRCRAHIALLHGPAQHTKHPRTPARAHARTHPAQHTCVSTSSGRLVSPYCSVASAVPRVAARARVCVGVCGGVRCGGVEQATRRACCAVASVCCAVLCCAVLCCAVVSVCAPPPRGATHDSAARRTPTQQPPQHQRTVLPDRRQRRRLVRLPVLAPPLPLGLHARQRGRQVALKPHLAGVLLARILLRTRACTCVCVCVARCACCGVKCARLVCRASAVWVAAERGGRERMQPQSAQPQCTRQRAAAGVRLAH